MAQQAAAGIEITMRRLSITAATTLAVALIGTLFVLLAWAAGSYFRDAALHSQAEGLSRIIEVASNQVLQRIQQQGLDLHAALNKDDNLSAALQHYRQGNRKALQALLDDPLLNGYPGADEIKLAGLRIYDLELNLLQRSNSRISDPPPQLPGFIARRAAQRKGIERLKAIGGLWVSAQGPFYSLLLPVGGLKPSGYIELIFDPAHSLARVEKITGMPLSVTLAAEPPPAIQQREASQGLLPVEYLLYSDDGQPAYRLIGMEDVSNFQQDMHTNQLITTLAFIAITFIILLLLLLMLNRGIFLPLKALLQGIERYRGGELDTRIRASGLRELFTLGETFNNMIEQIRHD
ncbi:MAG TPA: HAMP domain-containing protein, partial [Gammaproteobacteria bacterium]